MVIEKNGLSREMSAAERVEIVDRGAVVGFIRCLNSAFRHHCVCVADTKFRNYHYVRAGVMRGYCRGRTRPAAADNKYVDVVIGFGKVYLHARSSGFTLQKRGEFVKNFIAFVFADLI